MSATRVVAHGLSGLPEEQEPGHLPQRVERPRFGLFSRP